MMQDPTPNRRFVLTGALALLALPGIAVAQTSRRVVCAGADVTEIVADLAGIDAIQGVDTTSRLPPEVRKLPSIGYLRQVSAEGILSLRPDILIANRDLGPANAVDQIRSAGVRVEIIDFPFDAEGMVAKVRHVGAVLDREQAAQALAATVAGGMADLARRLQGVSRRPTIGFIRGIDGGTPLAGGRMGLVDATYALAGGSNAFGSFTLFKPVSREVLAASAPDFIVADEGTVAAAGGNAAFIDQLGLTTAFADHPERLVAADLATLFAFGPSGVREITALARRLHPDRFTG